MSFQITDHVPGFSNEDLAAMAAEAEAGYDLTGRASELNPHFQRLQLVPADLLDAIDQRAEKDGLSPEEVVRQALASYLHSA